MWGESSKNCEINCQCSGLITESFKINSGNSGTKRKQEEAHSTNFRLQMIPHSLDFSRKSPLNSPIATPSKRRVLGEIQNSPLFRPKASPVIERLRNTPSTDKKSPLIDRNTLSPLTSRGSLKRSSKITRIFEERTKFKMSNKENEFISETFMKIDVEEETRDGFGNFPAKVANWSMTKLDFTDALQSTSYKQETKKETIDMYVPEKDDTIDTDLDTLHDLEEEFDSNNFDECTKYEIISTDSPDIISSGRQSSRKIRSKNFEFGAPLLENEASTSFNKVTSIRTLNFEESFEFTSPAAKKSVSVKKSLKFSETPPKNPLRHEKSDSSIGSMSSSPCSSKLRIFPSESTTSMESGFISELEEPFLDMEELSSSPKMENFNELLSGTIKDNFEFTLKRPLQRSFSLAAKPKSLFTINENKKTNKRIEESCHDFENSSKRRKSNCQSPLKAQSRPVLQRAFSENSASIMSALAKSTDDSDLIGDFSLPFALPLICGDHNDLKSISCDTLAELLRGEYDHCISDYKVIDCRYPYEFEGGHILGAVNLYTQPQILSLVNKPAKPKEDKRSILVFHCEFSLERGPKLFRYLRSSDRAKNQETYPSLNYPEVYLLHQGYRSFYKKYPDLCTPAGYTAMLDPKYKDSLKRHRSFHGSTSKHGNKIL